MITASQALPGRTDETMPVPERHFVLDAPLVGPWPQDCETLVVAMGCFWGAERIFWQTPGVYSTSVGYVGGYTPNPTYEETCSGLTGHTEAVMVVFNTKEISAQEIMRVFWENHNPTQGMRQGNDVGTQYRSGIYYANDEQKLLAESTCALFQEQLTAARYGDITSEIALLENYFYAEPYHQQYLGKNPNGYCGIGGTGVSCPIGLI